LTRVCCMTHVHESCMSPALSPWLMYVYWLVYVAWLMHMSHVCLPLFLHDSCMFNDSSLGSMIHLDAMTRRCVTWLIYVPRLMYVTWFMCYDLSMCAMIHVCSMTRQRVPWLKCHDSWMCDMSRVRLTRHCVTCTWLMLYDMTRQRVTWLMYMPWLMYVPWLMNVPWLMYVPWLVTVWYDSWCRTGARCKNIVWYDVRNLCAVMYEHCVLWFVRFMNIVYCASYDFMCDMTYNVTVWYDSYYSICDMTHENNAWSDS